MQFALLTYHAPEEFAMRENDYTDPISARGELTTKRWWRPEFTSAVMHLKSRRPERRC